MALLVSSRFDEIEQAMRSVDGRYLLRSRSTQEWRLGTESFGNLTAIIGTNGASVAYEGAIPAAFVMLVGNGRSRVNGARLAPDQFVCFQLDTGSCSALCRRMSGSDRTQSLLDAAALTSLTPTPFPAALGRGETARRTSSTEIGIRAVTANLRWIYVAHCTLPA